MNSVCLGKKIIVILSQVELIPWREVGRILPCFSLDFGQIIILGHLAKTKRVFACSDAQVAAQVYMPLVIRP